MKVLIAGDLHASPMAATSVLAAARKTNADQVWQVGDFGYWPNSPGAVTFLDILEDLDVPLYFADGNHEDHLALDSTAPTLGLNPIRLGIFHVRRGTVLDLAGLRVLFFGGAVSVDRTYRTPGVTWFHQELPTFDQLHAALLLDPVDIVVAHDVPAWVDFGYPPPHNSYWPEPEIHASNDFRSNLATLATTLKPKLWLAGHHHVRKSVPHLNQYCRVEVFASDGYRGTFATLDTDTLEIVDYPSQGD